MLVDHAAVIFLERAVQPGTGLMLAVSSDFLYRLDRILRAVGRQAFPIFVFCIVEGFFHTANRGKYLGRLFAAAAVSQLPFYLMNNTGPVGSELPVSLNTLATLAAGLLLVMIIDRILGPEHGEPYPESPASSARFPHFLSQPSSGSSLRAFGWITAEWGLRRFCFCIFFMVCRSLLRPRCGCGLAAPMRMSGLRFPPAFSCIGITENAGRKEWDRPEGRQKSISFTCFTHCIWCFYGGSEG